MRLWQGPADSGSSKFYHSMTSPSLYSFGSSENYTIANGASQDITTSTGQYLTITTDAQGWEGNTKAKWEDKTYTWKNESKSAPEKSWVGKDGRWWVWGVPCGG